jgi:hypothetical protein
MTVLCVESGVVYADGVAAIAAEGGANKTFEVTGTNSFATLAQGSIYTSGIVIRPTSGQETVDDGDITVGAKISGTFVSTVTGTDIRNLLTEILSLSGADNALVRRLIVNGQSGDSITFNDTIDAENIIIYNCDDGFLSNTLVNNTLINKCTVIGANRFGFAQGKFTNCVDVNSSNQGYFNESSGSTGTWENDGSGTDSITESPAIDIFVDFAGGKYGVLDTSSPGAAGAGAFIFTASSGISLTATLGTIEYNSNDTAISLTGSVDVVATLGTISYSSNDTTVNLFGVVDVNATLGTINYESNDAVILLQGLTQVVATLGTISYDSYNVNVQVGAGQIIGTVTAGFANDIYSSSFKPSTITVNFKS